MATAYDQWLEEPYQAAEVQAAILDTKIDSLLRDHGWLSVRMPAAAESVADELAEVICDKAVWTDAEALLMGWILMDELRAMAELEARS